MGARILDGKSLAEKMSQQLKKEVSGLKKKTGRVPVLVNIMIGKDNSSLAYANSQKKAAEYIGIDYKLVDVSSDITQQEVINSIEKFNKDGSTDGIMIYKPVPAHIDYRAIANHISTEKDIEGINASHVGRMILGEATVIPSTPAAVFELIKSTKVPLKGKEVVIVGHSEIVGKPLSMLLLDELATVTVCHIGTSEAGKLVDHVKRADILIVAVGKAGLIKGEWIKPGAVVIDVGINHIGDKITGDVEFEQAEKKAAYITPVPGGVGPVTVMILMKNGVEAFKRRIA